MTAKRRLKLAALRLARAAGLFALARRLTARHVKILGYHYVSTDDEDARRFPALFLTPEAFRARLEHLRRCYRVVPLDEAVQDLIESRPGRGRVAITFDDGLANFGGAAAPVMRELGVPATVYVVTAHVESGIPTCTLLLRDVLDRAETTELRESLPEIGEVPDLGTPAGRADFRERVTEHLVTHPTASPERLAFVRRVAGALGVDVDAILERRTWHFHTAQELRELSEAGFAVEVHGHEHLDVVREVDRVYDEVATCARILEEITGRRPTHYCYPTGLWSRESWPAIERAGMRSATTTLYGVNSPKTPPLSLRRYMDSGNLTQVEFEFELSGLRWLLWAPRNREQAWAPAEKLVTYSRSGQLY